MNNVLGNWESLYQLWNSGAFVFLLEMLFASTVLLALLWGGLVLCKRASASERFLACFVALLALTALPLAQAFIPAVKLSIIPVPTNESVKSPSSNRDTRPGSSVHFRQLHTTKRTAEDQKPTPTQVSRQPLVSTESVNRSMEQGLATAPASNSESGTRSEQESALPTLISQSIANSSAREFDRIFLVWFFTAGLLMMLSMTGTRVFRQKFLSGCRTTRQQQLQSQLDHCRRQLAVERPVWLLISNRPVLPMTWGVLRPKIVLPNDAENWTDEKTNLVLLHELAHIKRNDVFKQGICRIICCMFWFQPLAWFTLRKMRFERELACDEMVFSTGADRSFYATQLVDLARSHSTPAGLQSMNMSASNLQRRVIAIFDSTRSRRSASNAAKRRIVSIFVAVCACLGSMQFEQIDLPDVDSAEQDIVPSPKEIVAKYIEALGGRDKLESIESMSLEWRVEKKSGDVNWNREEFLWQKESWVSHHYNSEEKTWSTGAVGRLFWGKQNAEKSYPLINEIMLYSHRANDHSFQTPLRMLQELDGMTVLGRDLLGDRDVWVVQYWSKTRSAQPRDHVIRYFDVQSGLLVRKEFHTSGRSFEHVYHDFQAINDVMFPQRIEVKFTQHRYKKPDKIMEFTRLVNDLELNVDIELARLKEPAELGWNDNKLICQGTICDEKTGRPIPNVHIGRLCHNWWPPLTMTDDQGRFRLYESQFAKLLGDSTAEKWKDGIYSADWVLDPPSYSPQLMKFRQILTTEGRPVPTTIKLKKIKILRGQVVDETTGKGLESSFDVHVGYDSPRRNELGLKEIRFESAMYPLKIGVTDPEGRFTIPVINGDVMLWFFPDAEGYLHRFHGNASGEIRRSFVIDDDSELNDVVIKCERFGNAEMENQRRTYSTLSVGARSKLSGKITNGENGEVIAGRVLFLPQGCWKDSKWQVIDSEGRFRFDEHVSDGLLVVQANERGKFEQQRIKVMDESQKNARSSLWCNAVFDVKEVAEDPLGTTEIALEPALPLSIDIVDMDGNPASNFYVCGAEGDYPHGHDFDPADHWAQEQLKQRSENVELYYVPRHEKQLLLMISEDLEFGAARLFDESRNDEMTTTDPIVLEKLATVRFKMAGRSTTSIDIRVHEPEFMVNQVSIGGSRFFAAVGSDFEFKRLIPGIRYRIIIRDFDKLDWKPTADRHIVIGPVKPGEDIDLGTLRPEMQTGDN